MSGAQSSNQTRDEEANRIERAKEFDPEAWNTRYDAYYPKMYMFLYVRLGERSAAEDLAADVFEQACMSIRRFRYRGAPISAWLYRIARNLMVDFLKLRGRAQVGRLEPDNEAHGATADASGQLALRDQLSRALRGLTEDQQQVLLLRHIEGHNVATTAAIMGKKDNAVRAQEFRALRSLRRILTKDGEVG